MNPDGKMSCLRCGGKEFLHIKTEVHANTVFSRYRCENCKLDKNVELTFPDGKTAKFVATSILQKAMAE